MNTSQKDPKNKAGAPGVDDLTRFLDEDFDTDDVDLFEFTSEEDSPLTQLKSIILSLDWEITDETLQDLNEEIEHLRNLETFANDKVAQVYLQGLDKIGSYILSEGAYAHPNSIKLLLTFYYDFEKILSSEHITGAEITALLKADVRKFKILQHQIARKHGAAETAAAEVAAPLPVPEHKTLQGLQASVLELDWEVTDDGLRNMVDRLDALKAQFGDDRYIQVLLQGLYSINNYIDEERARTHPEAFTLLHNFYDALERMIEDGELEEELRQELVLDCINRLNNLKSLIIQTYPEEEVSPEAITPVAEEEVAVSTAEQERPADAEETFEAGAAEEEMEELEGAAGEEDVEIAPALYDSEEQGGYAPTAGEEAPPEELTEKLESFFGSEEETFAPEAIEKAAAEKADEEKAAGEVVEEEPEEEIAPALAGSPEDHGFTVEGEEGQEPPEGLEDKLTTFFGEEEEAEAAGAPVESSEAEEEIVPAPAGEEEPGEEEEEFAPALADSEESAGFGAEGTEMEAPPEELEDKLRFFFGSEEEEEPAAEPPSGPHEAEEEVAPAPGVEEEPGGEEEEEFAPALADSEESAGFGAEGTETEAPPEELEDKLTSFFGAEEEVPAAEAPAEPAAEEEEVAPALAGEEETGGEEEEEFAPALADSEESAGFGAEGQEAEAPPEELEDKLEFFFGGEEEAAPTAEQEQPPGEEEEEEVLLTSAIEEPQIEQGPAVEETPVLTPTEPVEEVRTAEQYQAALSQIRNEFKEVENSLRQQIEILQKEMEDLRSRLG